MIASTVTFCGGRIARADLIAQTPANEQRTPATTAPAVATPEHSAIPAELNPCGCVWPTNAFRHDGWYGRLGFGLHYFSLWGDGPRGSASISGFAAAFNFAVGGTPWDGLVIAGTLGATYAGGSFHGGPPGAPGDAEALLPFVGALVDWYPAPRGRVHAGGTFGLGGFLATDSSNRAYRGYAPAGSLFAGIASWQGPQVSIDVQLVLSISAPASATDQYHQSTGYELMSLAGGLEYSFLVH